MCGNWKVVGLQENRGIFKKWGKTKRFLNLHPPQAVALGTKDWIGHGHVYWNGFVGVLYAMTEWLLKRLRRDYGGVMRVRAEIVRNSI